MLKFIITEILVFLAVIGFSQTIYWADSEIFETEGTGLTGITSDGTNIFGIDNSNVYTINQGAVSVLHTDVNIETVGVGGVGCINDSQNYSGKLYALNDMSLIYEFNDFIQEPYSVKGDTVVFLSIGTAYLHIAPSFTDEIICIAPHIGLVILNQHIYSYGTQTAQESEIVDYDINDLSNPIFLWDYYSVSFVSFLDTFQIKCALDIGFVFKEGIGSNYVGGWNIIDNSIFNEKSYSKAALSYYGENNDICVTFLNDANGDLLQVYTAGLASNTIKDIEDDFIIVPNPAKNEISINTSKKIKSIKVYNITGNLILNKKSEAINISNLKSGLYFIEINMQNNVKTKKFIKK